MLKNKGLRPVPEPYKHLTEGDWKVFRQGVSDVKLLIVAFLTLIHTIPIFVGIAALADVQSDHWKIIILASIGVPMFFLWWWLVGGFIRHRYTPRLLFRVEEDKGYYVYLIMLWGLVKISVPVPYMDRLTFDFREINRNPKLHVSSVSSLIDWAMGFWHYIN